jgi:hyperosmotically inducible periplasmic protein
MLRSLVRAILVLVVLAAAAAFLLGYRLRSNGDTWTVQRDRPSIGATGTSGAFDTEKARERAAQLGERAAATANEAAKALDDGALTAKIKAKMALDDHVRARAIDVDTKDGVVTLSGAVNSADERARALRLASETAGVRDVKDRLTVK